MCNTNPCNASNIVECVNGVTDTYECVCLPGFTGPQCEIGKFDVNTVSLVYCIIIISLDIDECAAFPCHNSAPCIDERNDYLCACISPWKGKDCKYRELPCLWIYQTNKLLFPFLQRTRVVSLIRVTVGCVLT